MEAVVALLSGALGWTGPRPSRGQGAKHTDRSRQEPAGSGSQGGLPGGGGSKVQLQSPAEPRLALPRTAVTLKPW
jgi:hypothetical protein